MNYRRPKASEPKQTLPYELFTTLSRDSQGLEILLKPDNSSHYYQVTLKNDCLPSNLLTFFETVADVHDCLQDPTAYSVKLEEGQILLKMTFQVKERRILKEAIIQMEKVKNGQGGSLSDVMMELKELKEEFANKTQSLEIELEAKEKKINQYE